MKIGIDIGGSHIALAVVDEKGNVLEKIENDINKKENLKEYIANYLDGGIKRLSNNENIEKIGIAVPGSPNGMIAKNLINLGIDEFDFSFLKEKYNSEVIVTNDANAAAMAEKSFGALKDCKDGIFLCLGTGIGGAVFINNQLLQASKNPGFELGHMIIEKNGILCNCGKRGCFETYCSMKRFKEKIKNRLKEIYSNEDSLESNNIQEGMVLRELLIKNIEDKEIENIIKEYIENLIIGLSNIIDIFEPETICLGGSFVYFNSILYDRLVGELRNRKYVFNKQSELPEIKLAQLDNDAGIIGAALL